MLDHTHQPSARLLARLRMTATEHKLPPEFADIVAQDRKMTAVRMAEIAPGLLLIADLGKRNRLNAEELEQAVGEYVTALGSDTPAADPQVLPLLASPFSIWWPTATTTAGVPMSPRFRSGAAETAARVCAPRWSMA